MSSVSDFERFTLREALCDMSAGADLSGQTESVRQMPSEMFKVEAVQVA